MTLTEDRNELLYSDPSNPYESIYIRAVMADGKLTVTDDECEHGPDGGWSYKTMQFDEENTQKLLAHLSEGYRDPFRVLEDMVGYEERTGVIEEKCREWNISFKIYFGFS